VLKRNGKKKNGNENWYLLQVLKSVPKEKGEQKRMCKAPWSRNCPNTDYIVALFWKGKRREICRRCWDKCPQNLEWGKGARSRKEVKKEIESAQYKKVSYESKIEISDTKLKEILKNYIKFGKHSLIRKDSEVLKEKTRDL